MQELYGKTVCIVGCGSVGTKCAKRFKAFGCRLLVRINPIHEATKEYCSSKEEIDIAIANGADIIMLPFFKTLNEVAQFLTYVDGRV